MTTTLREQVAQAIYDSDRRSYSSDPEWDELDGKGEYWANADAAIGVVLAAFADEIKALPEGTDDFAGEPSYLQADVLAMVERLRG